MRRGGCHITGWILIALILGPLCGPVGAQNQNLSPGSPQYEAYTAEVSDRLASREGLEDLYKKAATRQAQLKMDVQALKSMPCPAATDQAQWNAQIQQRTAEIEQEMQKNDALLVRYREKLGSVYTKLQGDLDRINNSNDEALKQQIGTLVGAGGGAVVPIWNRMTAADYAALARYGANNAGVAAINRVNPALQNVATNAGARAANAESALGALPSVQWVAEASPTSANMRLVATDAATGEAIAGRTAIETNVPARITNAQGQVVDNPNAMGAANDLAQLYNTRSQIGTELSAAKLKLSRGVNSAQKEFFERRVADLEAKKTALEADIQTYESQNPSVGTRAKALAKDAGKWALMSVGITLGANVIDQMIRNNGKVDWGQASQFLVDPHFWGGTAGSFVGSMAGTAIASAIPGGIFVKTLLSIGGAAVGWQLGSGQGGKTDWAALGVTTLGSTAGFMLGMAIGGPVGAFLGGIIGQLASQYIYDKVKEWLIKEEASSSYEQTQVPSGTTVDTSQVPVSQVPVSQVPATGQVPTTTQYPGQVPITTGQVPTTTQYPGQVPVQIPGGTTTVGTGQAPVFPQLPGVVTGTGTGQVPNMGQAPTVSSGQSAEVTSLTQQMNKAYNDYLAYSQAGERDLAALRLREYQEFRTKLQGARQSSGGPADFHNSR